MKIEQMEPSFGDEEKDAVMDYLNSGGWLTEHKKTREFEKMIADYVGSKYCSVVSNGTVSLVTALMALGIKPGDEVIVPDYTMAASAFAVSAIGAKPVLVDVETESFGIDYLSFEKKVTDKTKAIILVEINGRFPYFGEQIIDYCGCKDIHVIEDSAQCLGSYNWDDHIGTIGEVGSFSFSMPKIITTGQGGALVTDDKELYEKICMIKNFGRKKSGVDKHYCVGLNFKFTDLQAVIGIEQMKKLDERVLQKKENYMRYYYALKNIKEIKFTETDLVYNVPWMNDILVKNRNKLQKDLMKYDIKTRPFYPTLHSFPCYNEKGEFRNSTFISKHGLWLPSSLTLTPEEIDYVCETIKKVIK